MSRKGSSHTKRLITGLVASPVLLLIIYFNGNRWPFYILLIAASQLCLYEVLKFKENTETIIKALVHVSSFICLIFLALRHVLALPFLLVLPLVAFIFWAFIKGERPTKNYIEDIYFAIFCLVYITLPFSCIILIDMYPSGPLWAIFLLVVVFAGDTAAFYTGKGFGRKKLSPHISPNKTWEGAIGSTVASVLIGILFSRAFRLHSTDLGFVIFLVLFSLVAQGGDLFESYIKRVYDKKDSGVILPGHGGLLDRIDGLLFASPFLLMYLLYTK